jgi:hypothetical protein
MVWPAGVWPITVATNCPLPALAGVGTAPMNRNWSWVPGDAAGHVPAAADVPVLADGALGAAEGVPEDAA